jgi:hypothetical protein
LGLLLVLLSIGPGGLPGLLARLAGIRTFLRLVARLRVLLRTLRTRLGLAAVLAGRRIARLSVIRLPVWLALGGVCLAVGSLGLALLRLLWIALARRPILS